MSHTKTGLILIIILGLSMSLSGTGKPDADLGSEIMPARGEYQPNPNCSNSVHGIDVIMSNLVGININSNFGGWTGDYFMEMYTPAADGWINSIDFHIADFPDEHGGSMSVRIYEANYPWDEINTEVIADAAADANLGYYDETAGFEITGTNWVKGGINAVEGATANYEYDPLGSQGWPAFGAGTISLPPNADDGGWLNFDLKESMGTHYVFTRDVPFIVVVHLDGFPEGGDSTKYRMGFYAGVKHVEPQPSMKFYNRVACPQGRTGIYDWGWHIRSYVWDWNINATLSGGPHPLYISMDRLNTTLSTDAREVRAIITDGNPDGIASASLFYTINNGISVEVAMTATGIPDEYAAIIPGQQPGTVVTYWVEAADLGGITRVGEANTYSIFEVLEPILLVHDDNSIPSFYHMYNLPDTFDQHYDLWEDKFGPVSEVLLSNYEIIYHTMGGGPTNDATLLAPIYSAWLATGTADAPKRLFIAGQDYGAISGYDDTTFPAGAFENMYLGVETLGPQDINYDGTVDSYTLPYAVNAVTDDITTGFLKDYAGDSLQMYYEPAYEIGVNNWIDNFTPTSSATVCLTDPNNSDAAVACYNSGTGWKTAFWAVDPIALNYYSPVDTSSMYHWAMTTVGNPVTATFEWFGYSFPIKPAVDDDPELFQGFKLYANYPNPFNPNTTIRYELPESSDVTITIYDLLGRDIWSYEKSAQLAGSYSLQWNGQDNNGKLVASGVYLISFSTPEFRTIQKALLIR